jgi:NADPH:quinone reductase-like Zn-dependent oxidoreductase
MKAAAITGYGGPDNLQILDLPAPTPGPSDVLVRVAYSALNRADLFIRQGLTGPGVRQPRELPHVLGVDGAGVIVELGADVSGIRVGDRVAVFPALSCGHCRHCRRGENSRCSGYGLLGEDEWGLQRELIALPATSVLPIADNLSLADAAAVPGAYTTAWTMLITRGRLRVGERVLVVGASGGVSVAAMQIAAQSGAEVWATTRQAEKAKRLRELPFVHRVFETPVPGWSEEILQATAGEGVDLVVDAVGAPTWPDSIRAIAQGGRLLVCGATGGDSPDISIREIYQRNRQIIGGPFGGWNDFRQVYAFLSSSGVRPVIDRVLPLEAIAEAHRVMEKQEHIGKLMLRCADADPAEEPGQRQDIDTRGVK